MSGWNIKANEWKECCDHFCHFRFQNLIPSPLACVYMWDDASTWCKTHVNKCKKNKIKKSKKKKPKVLVSYTLLSPQPIMDCLPAVAANHSNPVFVARAWQSHYFKSTSHLRQLLVVGLDCSLQLVSILSTVRENDVCVCRSTKMRSASQQRLSFPVKEWLIIQDAKHWDIC